MIAISCALHSAGRPTDKSVDLKRMSFGRLVVSGFLVHLATWSSMVFSKACNLEMEMRSRAFRSDLGAVLIIIAY